MEEQKGIGVDLSIASKEMIEALIAETADADTFEEILQANIKRPDIIGLLLTNPEVPENIKTKAAELLQSHGDMTASSPAEETTPEIKSQTLMQKIQQLSVSEKRLLAMRGGREARSILFKDTNKQVMLAVLENPKITETEIELLAHSRSIPDEALRTITKNKAWMKNYGIVLAVATNPKTPPGVAIPMLYNLKMKDLATIEKNRNVAEALRTAAKKLVQARKPH